MADVAVRRRVELADRPIVCPLIDPPGWLIEPPPLTFLLPSLQPPFMSQRTDDIRAVVGAHTHSTQ